MISLLTGIYQYFFQKQTYWILIVGLDNAGKTTFLEQVKSSHKLWSMSLDKIVPTVGLNIAKFQRKEGEFVFWDLGGQAGLWKLWSKYYEETQGVIFIVDGADTTRFQEARD